MCTGTVPHVGGPVMQGSVNVLAGNKPAATVGHPCLCVGPPSTIAQGEARVLINGMPAATMGSMTSHAGTITAGEPTVLIGTQAPAAPASAPPDRLALLQRNPDTRDALGATEPLEADEALEREAELWNEGKKWGYLDEFEFSV